MSAVASGNQDILKQLDDSRITGFHWKIMFVSSMGFFTDAYDLFIIGVALALIKPEWHPSSFESSLVSALALLSAAIGAIVFGRIADLLGRKRVYGYEVLILAAAAIACAFSPNIWWLIVFRFILGIGIGGDYPVSSTIMSEYAGRSSRGLMVSLVFAAQAAGLIVGPLIAAGLLVSGVSHDLAWRLMLGFGAIPGLAVFYLRRQIQETPRFTMESGHHEEFSRAAGNILGQHNQSGSAGDPSKHDARPSFMEGFALLVSSRRLLAWTIAACGAWFMMDFAYYGNTISGPIVLKALDPKADLLRTTLEQLVVFAVFAVPGYAAAALTMDRLGRKFIQIMGFVGMTIAFGLVAFIPGVTKLVIPFLILYGLSYFFTEYGPNTTTFVYPSEIFPTRVRTTAAGLATAVSRIGGFIGVFCFPYLLNSYTLAGAERVAGLTALIGIALTLLLPEPKGKSLEELAAEAEASPAAMRGAGAQSMSPA